MIDVSCALITRQNGQILVTQRSAFMSLPLKWEFPGGKVEPGETAAECVVREIAEELGVQIETVEQWTDYLFDNGKQIIRLIPFHCRLIKGDISLTEHAAFQWLSPGELSSLDWSEADLPILRDYLESCR